MPDYPITESSVQDEVLTSQDALNTAAEALTCVFTTDHIDNEYLPNHSIMAQAASTLIDPDFSDTTHINTRVMVNDKRQRLACWTDSQTVGEGLTAIYVVLEDDRDGAGSKLRIIYDSNMIAIRAEKVFGEDSWASSIDPQPTHLVYAGIAIELIRQGIYLREDEIREENNK